MTPEEIENIFLQGDVRYDSFSAHILSEFFKNKALEIMSEDISTIKINDINFEEISGPQKNQKAVVTKILSSKEFNLIGYERDIGWGKVDVLGITDKDKFIAIECGPCRLTKVIDYFRWDELEELWLISIYYEDKKIYFIKRGQNWENMINQLDNEKFKEIRKIKSPLDD